MLSDRESYDVINTLRTLVGPSGAQTQDDFIKTSRTEDTHHFTGDPDDCYLIRKKKTMPSVTLR